MPEILQGVLRTSHQKRGNLRLGDRVFSLPVMRGLKAGDPHLQLAKKVKMLRGISMPRHFGKASTWKGLILKI
jgi:hypothetical protein